MSIFNRSAKSLNGEVKRSDYFTSEFEINGAPVGARNLLTKGFVQDEINQYSGAAITTRGRFISKNDHQKSPADRPLYLFIQGPTKQSIELAIQKIHETIRDDIGNPIHQGMNAVQGGNRSAGLASQTVSKPPPLMGVSTNLTQVEKLYIGLDGLPASFDLRGKIIGPSGSNLHYIRSETGAAVTLRGRGSQFMEAASGRESAEPLHLYLEHPRPEGLATARQLAVNLVETLVLELQQTDFPQQQIMNTPLQMSIPPPTQQHVAAPPQFSIDQPWMINTQNNAGQAGGSSNQQQFQLQQVTLQPPPRPPTHVNIPPPGVHIPQHTGPLVPPPQLVQLSAPPPPTPNAPHAAPPVLVVGPPPPQPLYLPPDLVASSSLGTFSLVQGGLVYHQAPPVQTQAQIGDGQMMNTQQGDGTMSINPHSQPPPQMIITQVQLDPNSQMITPNDQVSHNFQSNNQQKFHVIGHIQNQFNRDNSVQQPQQQMARQNQDGQGDHFSHYTTNQTTNPNTTIMNSPYQTNMVGSNSHFSTVDQESQNQLRHINMGHHSVHLQQSDQESGKQTSRQMQSEMNQQKLENQRQINTQMPPNQNQIQQSVPANNYQTVADNRSSQAILSQMPPNRPPHQMISEGPPSNQMQGNNQFSNQQGNNQVPQNTMNPNQQSNQMTSPLQDNSQIATNQQQMRQMPPNQFPSDINGQQLVNQQPMNLQQVNQQQMNTQPYSQQDTQQQQMNQQPPIQRNFIQPFVSNQGDLRQEPKRHENLARNKTIKGGRNRRGLRNNRQYVYPWSRSEQDRPNQQNDPVWQRKESIREFEYDRKVNEFQRNNESRPSRFQPPDSDNVKPQSEDSRQSVQFRNDEDEIHNQQENKNVKSNNSGAPVSNNQSGQRMFPHQYGHGDSNQPVQLIRNRSDTEQRKERSPEGGRKRKFEQESLWANKPGGIDAGKSTYKKRFDQEDYKAGVAGSQSSGKSPNGKPFKPTESVKSERSTFSKWSDKKGESVKKLEKSDLNKEDHDGNEKMSPKKNDGQEEKSNDKSTEAPWTEQRTEFKSNPVQYSNINQFQGQAGQVVSDMGNRQYQQNYQPYMNSAQMFQGNLPYHLQPPPPPPPGQSQTNSMQLQPNMQFNLPQGNNSAPPNMLMANSNIHHGFGQNPLGHAMSNVSQNVHPNMNSNVSSQLQPNMTPNVGQNLHQNAQYDMTQNIMTNIAHHIVPNNNYILPPGINQNVPLNIGQNLHPNIGQNMSPNMGQIMPSQLQVMSQNMGQNMAHNLGHNLMPNMAQSPSSYMGHNIPNSMQHTLGQNVMNQNMNTTMGQSAPSNAVQNIPPNINQMTQQSMTGNMGQSMPSMMGTNSPNMNQNAPINIPNNINQSMPMNMQSMNQMPHNMVPSMVPPPINGVGPPPMMPPNMVSTGRPHMAPPPPPPNVHTMTSQPPYPYWVN